MSMENLHIKLGMLFVLVALTQAWLVVARRYLGVRLLERWIRSDQDLIRSHIDFILMALLLFAFAKLDPAAPELLVYICCAGAIGNPLLFVILALKPDVSRSPLSPFGLFSAVSFTATTIGFGGRGILYLIA